MGTKTNGYQTINFSKPIDKKKLGILIPIRFDTPLGAGKETAKRVPKQTGTKTPTVATEIKVNLIPREYFVAFAFALILIGTDDTSHSCPHRDFTPNLTFALAFVIQKVINSESYGFASL